MNGKREKQKNAILAAMTFEEIGRELGISGNGAWRLYKNALRKLRRLPRTYGLLELARSRDELRATDQLTRRSSGAAASSATCMTLIKCVPAIVDIKIRRSAR